MFLRLRVNFQITGFKVFPQQLHVNTNRCKRVFYFVSHRRCKIGEARKVFKSSIIDFLPFPLRNVLNGNNGAAYPFFFHKRQYGNFDILISFIRNDNTFFCDFCFFIFYYRMDKIRQFGVGNQRPQRTVGIFCKRNAENPRSCTVSFYNPMVRIQNDNAVSQ